MRALVYKKKLFLEYQNLKEEKTKRNFAKVDVNYVSICGSDILGYLGQSPGRVPPLVLGHEFTGIYNSKNVVVNPIISNKKNNILKEHSNLDKDMKLLGLHINGALRERVNVPKENLLYFNNKKYPSYLMSLTEPLACAINAVNSAKIKTNDNILVLGNGCLGFMIGLILKLRKFKNVHVYDNLKSKRILSKKNGSKAIYFNQIKKYSYEAIFDCVGSTSTQKLSLKSLKNGGKIILVGYKVNANGIDFVEVVRRQLSIIGIMAYSTLEFKEAFDIIKKNYKIFKGTIKIYKFSEAKSAFKKASYKSNSYLRHIIKI
tara:strand:+ start:456 stop:1406 length:951 start_codon:yes stop_codon:yes gene_type:complete